MRWGRPPSCRYEFTNIFTSHLSAALAVPCRTFHSAAWILLRDFSVHQLQEPQLAAEEADPQATVAAVHRRIVRIAEQAFWDSKAEALANNDTAIAAGTSRELASLLSSLGAELLAVLPAQVDP